MHQEAHKYTTKMFIKLGIKISIIGLLDFPWL